MPELWYSKNLVRNSTSSHKSSTKTLRKRYTSFLVFLLFFNMYVTIFVCFKDMENSRIDSMYLLTIIV